MWGRGKAGWGQARAFLTPQDLSRAGMPWARGLAPRIAQGTLSQLRSVVPREGPTQDGAGSPVLTGKCWKCLQEAFIFPSTRCT